MDTLTEKLNGLAPTVLSILRIMTALLIMQHGLQKWLAFPVANPMFANITLTSLIGVAGALEIVFGALVVVGAFTRFSAFVLSGLMAFAYFIGHAPRAFMPIVNGGNLAILYCFVFFYIIFAGPGPWSVDGLRRRG